MEDICIVSVIAVRWLSSSYVSHIMFSINTIHISKIMSGIHTMIWIRILRVVHSCHLTHVSLDHTPPRSALWADACQFVVPPDMGHLACRPRPSPRWYQIWEGRAMETRQGQVECSLYSVACRARTVHVQVDKVDVYLFYETNGTSPMVWESQERHS